MATSSRSHRSRSLAARFWAPACALGLGLALVALPHRAVDAAPPRMAGVQLVEAWPDAEFSEPVQVTHAKDGSDTLYVVEQPGRIHRIKKYRGVGPVPQPSVFLDIKSKVYARSQGGLLAAAFHPEFAQNRLFYVFYLAQNPNPGPEGRKFKIVIAEYRSNGARADPNSARVVLEIPKKTAQHQGGGLGFGPDGFLYIGTGDGNESKNDKDQHAQNARHWLGKILRIDPRGRTGNKGYGIPRNNPWSATGRGVLPEIWCYGLRNPWRFSWDESGRMWTAQPGTTGPESREWITQLKVGSNHGWPYMEGNRRLMTPPANRPIVPSTFEYVRGSGGSTCGIGGLVYRGDRVKALKGRYIFGDYMRGEAYCIDLVNRGGRVVGANFQTLGECPDLASFGDDEQGEVYLCSNGDLGIIFTLAAE